MIDLQVNTFSITLCILTMKPRYRAPKYKKYPTKPKYKDHRGGIGNHENVGDQNLIYREDWLTDKEEREINDEAQYKFWFK